MIIAHERAEHKVDSLIWDGPTQPIVVSDKCLAPSVQYKLMSGSESMGWKRIAQIWYDPVDELTRVSYLYRNKTALPLPPDVSLPTNDVAQLYGMLKAHHELHNA